MLRSMLDDDVRELNQETQSSFHRLRIAMTKKMTIPMTAFQGSDEDDDNRIPSMAFQGSSRTLMPTSKVARARLSVGRRHEV